MGERPVAVDQPRRARGRGLVRREPVAVRAHLDRGVEHAGGKGCGARQPERVQRHGQRRRRRERRRRVGGDEREHRAGVGVVAAEPRGRADGRAGGEPHGGLPVRRQVQGDTRARVGPGVVLQQVRRLGDAVLERPHRQLGTRPPSPHPRQQGPSPVPTERHPELRRKRPRRPHPAPPPPALPMRGTPPKRAVPIVPSRVARFTPWSSTTPPRHGVLARSTGPPCGQRRSRGARVHGPLG